MQQMACANHPFLAGSGLIIISLVYFGPKTGKTSLADNNSIGISGD